MRAAAFGLKVEQCQPRHRCVQVHAKILLLSSDFSKCRYWYKYYTYTIQSGFPPSTKWFCEQFLWANPFVHWFYLFGSIKSTAFDITALHVHPRRVNKHTWRGSHQIGWQPRESWADLMCFLRVGSLFKPELSPWSPPRRRQTGDAAAPPLHPRPEHLRRRPDCFDSAVATYIYDCHWNVQSPDYDPWGPCSSRISWPFCYSFMCFDTFYTMWHL